MYIEKRKSTTCHGRNGTPQIVIEKDDQVVVEVDVGMAPSTDSLHLFKGLLFIWTVEQLLLQRSFSLSMIASLLISPCGPVDRATVWRPTSILTPPLCNSSGHKTGRRQNFQILYTYLHITNNNIKQLNINYTITYFINKVQINVANLTGINT
ncbi:hypothetical protein T07_3924 [Trichinella nelsoni]|uniref:Uncharacterized protein n=1 Tax=Trichinella nelsoni TaxID=6336 RepID=A0A0V0SE29_9BILA|nr:hypothetical protein T07_3924 [Trichinella nelsoni]